MKCLAWIYELEWSRVSSWPGHCLRLGSHCISQGRPDNRTSRRHTLIDLLQAMGVYTYGAGQATLRARRQAVRMGVLELSDMACSCCQQQEFLLHWGNPSSALQTFQLKESGPSRSLRVTPLRVNWLWISITFTKYRGSNTWVSVCVRRWITGDCHLATCAA